MTPESPDARSPLDGPSPRWRATPDPSPIRVLLVDDDDVDREAVRRALQERPGAMTIEEAASIQDAEYKLNNGRFDCIVLDYLLPEGPCLGFLPGLRGKTQAGFIILTGQGDEQVAVEVMKAGASDYLSKDGLDPARLRRAIRYAVALRRAEHAAAVARADQDRHEGQLRRFVEGAPALVGARSFQELANAASALTRSVFGAAEVLVSLQQGETETVSVQHGDVPPPSQDGQPPPSRLAAWVAERRSVLPVSGNRLSGDRLASTLTSRDGECRGTIAVQLTRPVHPNELPMLDQIGVLVSVCSDSLLLYETAERAVRARDDILAAVSHDLRTPLNNLRLGASLLADAASPDNLKIIQRIDRSVVHMTHLVDALVDMVRIEGGKVDLSAGKDESVEDMLSSARQLIAPQAEAQRLRFVIEPPEAPLAVRADRHRTMQVLMNLLGNAVKFTPEGGQVTLRAGRDGDFVRFEVSDTGIGIAESEGERIFSRFWRSDPKKRRGLGLGLYIAKGLVVAHGGKLWFESTPGAGSRFFFTLPLSPRART